MQVIFNKCEWDLPFARPPCRQASHHQKRFRRGFQYKAITNDREHDALRKKNYKIKNKISSLIWKSFLSVAAMWTPFLTRSPAGAHAFTLKVTVGHLLRFHEVVRSEDGIRFHRSAPAHPRPPGPAHTNRLFAKLQCTLGERRNTRRGHRVMKKTLAGVFEWSSVNTVEFPVIPGRAGIFSGMRTTWLRVDCGYPGRQ